MGVWSNFNAWFDALIAILFGDGVDAQDIPPTPPIALPKPGYAVAPPQRSSVDVSAGARSVDVSREQKTRSVSEPRGWLGALFTHGSTCTAFMAFRLLREHELLPMLDCHWKGDTEGADCDPAEENRHFYEWSPPAFKGQAPDFIEGSEAYHIHRSTYESTINMLKNAGKGEGVDILNAMPDARRKGRRIPIGSKPAHAVGQYMKRTHDMGTMGSFENLDLKDRYFHGYADLILPFVHNRVEASEYWSKSDNRIKIFEKRLCGWYWCAHFAVWSAEMLRLHCAAAHESPPGFWWKHCLSWGIPIHKGSVPDNHGGPYLHTYYWKAKHDGDYAGFKGLKSDLTFEQWKEIALLVIYHSKVPGAPGTLGEQIADPGQPRSLFDIPEECDEAYPATIVLGGKWNGNAVAAFAAAAHKTNVWTEYVFPIWQSVCSILAGAAGGAFAAFYSAANAAFQAGCLAMQACAGLRDGTDIEEIAGAVMAIGKCAAQIGAAAGTDVVIPSDLWEQLLAFSEPIQGFAGDLADVVEEDAMIAQAKLETIVKIRDYGHVDALLGGIVAD